MPAPTQGVKSVNFESFVIENPIPQRSKECKIDYIACRDYAITGMLTGACYESSI